LNGEIDLRTSGAVGYLASALLNAHRESNLEERMAALEAVIAQQRPVQSLVADQGIKEISVSSPGSESNPPHVYFICHLFSMT